MSLEKKHKKGLLLGAIVGAFLGAGAAYLLLVAPSDEEPEPIQAKDLVGLTTITASFISSLDDIRRRI